VFAIALDPVYAELEADITELPAERADPPRAEAVAGR